MKIIQSFWGGKNKSITNGYGWDDYHYNWLSWALSCNQLLKFYNQVELYTDEFGYDVLIRKMKLPYTKVHIVLDELNEIPNHLWAISKIKVYSLQTEPFLHVDGDVFIFAPFPEEIINAELITQNQEITTNYYRNMWKNIIPVLDYLPQEMNGFNSGKNNLAHNMGIFGGNDILFLQDYSKKSLDFVFKNKSAWEKIKTFNFNVFFEQVLFYECVNLENKKVDVLIKEDIGDNEYTGFADFEQVPDQKTYLHLLGIFKQNNYPCRKMEQYCLRNFPEFIKRVAELTPEKYTYLNFDYSFTILENEKLIAEYEKNIFNEEITQQRLLARDLYTQNQARIFLNLNQNQKEYYLVLLQEFEIKEESGEQLLYLKELDGDCFLRKLDIIDKIVLHELRKPVRKTDFINIMTTYLNDSFTLKEVNEFKKTIIKVVLLFIQLKMVAVIPIENYTFLTTQKKKYDA